LLCLRGFGQIFEGGFGIWGEWRDEGKRSFGWDRGSCHRGF